MSGAPDPPPPVRASMNPTPDMPPFSLGAAMPLDPVLHTDPHAAPRAEGA